MPGDMAGVKRWARYHKRVIARKIKVKNPDKYLHSSRNRVTDMT